MECPSCHRLPYQPWESREEQVLPGNSQQGNPGNFRQAGNGAFPGGSPERRRSHGGLLHGAPGRECRRSRENFSGIFKESHQHP